MSQRQKFSERVAQRAGVDSPWLLILPIVTQLLTQLLAKWCGEEPKPEPPTPEEARRQMEQALDERPARARAAIAHNCRVEFFKKQGKYPKPKELRQVVDAYIDEILDTPDIVAEAIYAGTN